MHWQAATQGIATQKGLLPRMTSADADTSALTARALLLQHLLQREKCVRQGVFVIALECDRGRSRQRKEHFQGEVYLIRRAGSEPPEVLYRPYTGG